MHQWWKKEIAKPVSKIDDNVKHVFRGHNQEPEHWANVGAKDKGKLLLTGKVMPPHGWQSKDFWIAVARTLGKLGAVWLSKESTEKDGSRSAELQFL